MQEQLVKQKETTAEKHEHKKVSGGKVCPKCKYERKAFDTAPAWQCPACGIAYNKAEQKFKKSFRYRLSQTKEKINGAFHESMIVFFTPGIFSMVYSLGDCSCMVGGEILGMQANLGLAAIGLVWFMSGFGYFGWRKKNILAKRQKAP